MKLRSGFVSNSSSSSFIVIGVPLTKAIENMLKAQFPLKEAEEDWEWSERIGQELGLQRLYVEGKTNYVIGKVLADVGSDGGYLEHQNYSFEQLQEMMDDVRSKLGGGDIEPKLMMGTRPS